MPDVSAVERRLQTMQILREQGHASVSKLSEQFGVSEVTIRKDLSALEEESVIMRTHGGAVLAEHFKFDLPFDEQAARHADEKRLIGLAGAARIQDHDTLIISTGSTPAQVARHLDDKKGLTVLTNSLRIASDLLANIDVNLLLLGGQMHAATASAVGPYAEQMLRDHAFHKLFLAADGYDMHHGLTTTNMMEAHLQRVMIDVADEVIVVADSSKFGRRGLSRVCTVEDIDVFITDDRIPDAVVQHLEEAGVEVQVVARES